MEEKKREVWDGFFVLEGMDGAGTTTQLRLCRDRAFAEGLNLDCEAEPTDSPIGGLVRRYLRHERPSLPRTLAWLFAADREEHLFGPAGVRERLKKGKKVLSDRYLFSSLVYQSLDLDAAFVKNIQRDFPYPEVVFFLDVDLDTAEARRNHRNQKEELFEASVLQERIHANYIDVWNEARRAGTQMEIVRLDANLSVEELHAAIWARICR